MTTLAHPAWPDRSASVLGWTVSLLAHAVVVAWLLHAWNAGDRPRDAADAVPARRIEVRLVPLRPPPSRKVEAAAPSVAVSAASPARPRRPVAHADDDVHADADRDATAPVRPRAAPAHPRTRATLRAPEADAPASTIAVTPSQPAERQATPAGDAAPHVDLAAARSAARQFGREGGKSLVALPERKLVVDPNADRRVVDPLEAARRIDCQTARAQSTNLLANVVMLAVDLTKNAIDDSGCKW